jgi:hypothetical protein
MVKTYDPKCYALAEAFLGDDDISTLTATEVEQRIHDLACAIQQAIEDWCDNEASDMAAKAEHDAELKSLRGYSDEERERI